MTCDIRAICTDVFLMTASNGQCEQVQIYPFVYKKKKERGKQKKEELLFIYQKIKLYLFVFLIVRDCRKTLEKGYIRVGIYVT